MSSLVINGGAVEYEILGTAGELVVLTPGGRFGKDIPGLRPLADALVDGGHRVLLWDRPNCGRSDVQFFGRSESHMRADTLAELVRTLDVGPCILAGGSGGARDSILTAMLHPRLVTKLALWNIVGGIYGTLNLASVYVLPSLHAVRAFGIPGLVKVREWRERIAENPANEARLLALDKDEFTALSLRWLTAYVPKPGQTIPGVEDAAFDDLRVPTLIIRGGSDDLDHPKRTSLEVGCLIRGSVVIDPPWPEDAWERALEDSASGRTTGFNIFDTWVLAAPALLDFFARL